MKRLFVLILTLPVLLLSGLEARATSGYELIYPGAHRAAITQGYSTSHRAYDYRYSNYTAVGASQSGEVFSSVWTYPDNQAWSKCLGDSRDRGNYIILDHGDGLESWYFHLSNTGPTPAPGAQFDVGEYLALSDHNGCSTGPHLHHATKLDGTPFDPYDAPDWVSGEPIPAGFIDQDQVSRGPFALDRVKIRNKWLDLAGSLGAPLGDDYFQTDPPPFRITGDSKTLIQDPLAYTYIQEFERGIIYYTGSANAQYIAYEPTYLPDIRAHRFSGTSGWNSAITVRNDGPTAADISIVILNADGTTKDTRAYKNLRKNAAWTLQVREIIYSGQLDDWSSDFSGAAVVYAPREVSVVATQEYQNADVWAAYSGVTGPGSTAFVPVLHKNNNGWNSQIFIQNSGNMPAQVQIDLKPWSGNGNYHSVTLSVGARGNVILTLSELSDVDIGSTFIGSGFIHSDPGEQPLAISWSQYKGTESIMEASNAGGVGYTTYAPLVQNYNSGWASGVAIQNASSTFHSMNLKYHRYTNGSVCRTESRNISPYHVYIFPSPPGGGCSNVLTARVLGNGFAAAANVNQLKIGSNFATDYAAIANPGTLVGIPILWKNWEGWNSGIVIQNTTGLQTYITIKYYAKNGDFITSRTASLAQLGQAYLIYPIPVGDNFEGSAVVTANRAVAVVINHIQDGSTGDRIMTHAGAHH